MATGTQAGTEVDVYGWPGRVCHESRCVSCRADSECGGTNPYCVNGNCRPCREDVHCGGDTPVCVDGACRECHDKTQCAGLACNSGVCACTSNAECGGTRVCRGNGRCYCGSDADCPQTPGNNHCDLESGTCGCSTNQECASQLVGFDPDNVVCK